MRQYSQSLRRAGLVLAIGLAASFGSNAGHNLNAGAPQQVSLVFADGPEIAAAGRDVFHTPIPSTSISSPQAGSTLTGNGMVNIQGSADADCSTDPRAAKTYVQRVEVQFGTGDSWTPASIQLKDKDCRADWWIQLPLPGGQDNTTLVLRARTLSNHGGTEFMQGTPEQVSLKVDTTPPSIALVVGPWAGGQTFPVSWWANDGSGVPSFGLDYSVDGVAWQPWQTDSAGNATFVVSGSLPDPGRVVFFRAQATDGNGLQAKATAIAIRPATRVFIPGIMR